MLNALAFT